MQTQKTLIAGRETLSAALALAKGITPRKSSIPILGAIQLRHTAAGAEMVATDLDVYLSVSIPAEKVDEGFSAVLPHAALSDMVKKTAKGALITIDASGAGELASVALGAVRANLQAFASEDWPNELKKPDDKPAAAFTVSTRDFGAALTRCALAISTEETRYYLNGIYAHCVEAGKLRMVATDGHRLARAEIAADVTPEMPGVIIPRLTVDFLRKQCAGKAAPESLAVTINSNFATFTLGNVSAQSKLIDGTFPQYDRVIPALKGDHSTITVDRAAFIAAIEQISTVASERGRAFAMEPIEGGKLRLLVSNPDCGDIGAEIPCGHDGKAFVSGFNASYMLDCLKAEKSGLFRISMEDSGSPALVGDPDNALSFVLMPMRVGGSTKAESREERNARMAKEAQEAAERAAKRERARQVDRDTFDDQRRMNNAIATLHHFGGSLELHRSYEARTWANGAHTVDAYRFAAAVCEHELAKARAANRPEDPRRAPLATFLAGLNPLTRGAVVARHGVDAPELAPIYDAYALAAWILEATRKADSAPVATVADPVKGYAKAGKVLGGRRRAA
jgi:DNA polymerase III subunit beta